MDGWCVCEEEERDACVQIHLYIYVCCTCVLVSRKALGGHRAATCLMSTSCALQNVRKHRDPGFHRATQTVMTDNRISDTHRCTLGNSGICFKAFVRRLNLEILNIAEQDYSTSALWEGSSVGREDFKDAAKVY